jgi:hypothetical protein
VRGPKKTIYPRGSERYNSLPAHLLISSDAVRFAGEAEKTREAEAAQWRRISLSTDVDSSTVLPDMRF